MIHCPHCSGRLIVRHNEAWCWTHGTISTERLPHDAVWEPAPLRDREASPRTGTPWTDEEWAFVEAHFEDMSAAEIAPLIQRTPAGIHKRLVKLGVSKPHPKRHPDVAATVHARAVRAGERRRWTQEEDDFLEDNIGRGMVQFVGSRLGRSPRAIQHRLQILGSLRADGMLTVSEVARMYWCSRWRIYSLVRAGTIPSHRIPGTRYYRIDPADCERIADMLTAPKQTYKGVAPDMGDYRQRYKGG